MATPAYEGGIGGKFRRRLFRRAAATPYDRPPSAIRGLRGIPAEAGGGGWLSKLVDPASRFIAGSATRFFSSVFRKRLTGVAAPVQVPDENHQSRQEVPEVACINPSPELQEGDRDRDRDGDNPTNNSDMGGISELEQLLKQKTFTRVEFDHLVGLLHSRTVEPVTFEQELNNERKGKGNASAQENGIRSSKLDGNLSTPAGSLTVETASPAELAKAYMVSGPSKLSSSAVSLRSQVLREHTVLPSNVPSASKPLDLSVAPRSVIRFSGIPELPEISYQTPRPRGRSAMYRMSKSPYFKSNLTANVKGGELPRDGYNGPSSSQWTPRNAMHSDSKKVLKRGSSVLDSDFGSFGPIRRIRHKANLMFPSKDTRSSLSGNLLSSQSTPLDKDVTKGSTSMQKPVLLGERKYDSAGLQDVENGDNRMFNAGAAPLPPQSRETARKILQQLDKLLPSPKEKSSELKTTDRHGSPSKLTSDMLHGWALRSMEDIDSSKFLNMQGSGDLDIMSDSPLPSLKGALAQKLDRVEENGPLKSAVVGVKLTYEANGMGNAVIPATDAKPGVRPADFAISRSAALPPRKKPAFQMSAPEDSVELDDDDYNTRDVSSTTTGNDELESKIPEHKTVISETVISEKSMMPSSQRIPVSSSVSVREADKKVSIQPVVAGKDIGFTFPVTTAPCTHSQPPPTPTMPTPLLERSAIQKEQEAAPVFSFSTKSANTDLFSSTTAGVSDTSGLKVGAGSGSELNIVNSNFTTSAEGSNLDKVGDTQKAGGLFKSFGNAVSSAISTSTSPVVFGFGASTTPSLSNGSLHSSPLTFSVSGTPVATLSNGPVSSIFSNNTATPTSSSSPISSAALMFSTGPSFQFGSGTSTTAPVSVSPPLHNSNSTDLEAKPVKASPFSMSSSAAQGTPTVFSSTGSCSSSAVTALPTFPSTSSAPPSALATSAASSNTGSSSVFATSLFPGMGSSGSSLAPSSAFLSTGSSIFGFSASTQSSTLSSSFVNSSSQNSTTAATFATTGGSVFGSQSTHSGNGESQFSQSSTSQFGSFSSSPAFGANNSSSSSFGISSFGSVTSGTKPFSSSSGFSFSTGASSSSSQTPTSSIFGPTSGSSMSFPSTGFSFGQSAPSSSSSPFTFGSSSGSLFSFTASGATTSLTSCPAQPVFGIPTAAVGFSSGSPGNDQMNVEDGMADDTNQASVSFVPSFGQLANSPATPSFMFGSPAVPSGGPSPFQFGSQQNPPVPQSLPPFQTAGNLEFPPGGSFSLGSGGGDKSGRKFVKIRRDKLRKK